MEAASAIKESPLRAKLEFGVMRSAFDRAHLAWSNARPELKPALLLGGQTLTRAEGWLHDFPEKLSDSEKSFIMASIAKNSMDGQRDGTIIEQVLAKSSNGTFWLVVVTFFLIVRLFIPMAVEQLTGVPVKATDPEVSVAAGHPVGQRTGVGADGPADDAGDRPQAGASDDEDAGAASPAALQRQAKLESQRRVQKLTVLARTQIAKGDIRTAMLLAIEAAHPADAAAANDDAASAISAAGSLIVESLSRRLAEGATPAGATKGPTALFCGDGSTVVTAAAGDRVRVISVDPRRPASELKARDHLLRAAAVAASCDSMMLNGSDDTAEHWSLSTGRRIASMAGHEGGILGSAISADGHVAATGGQDAIVRLWDARSGRRRASLEGHEWAVNAVAFSPDGKRLISASADKTARVWLVDEGRSVMTLAGHAGSVTSATFSPDGKRILTIGLDGHALLWETASGQQLRRLQHRNTAIMQARFSPDGRRIATQLQDGGLAIWEEAGDAIVFDPAGTTGLIRDFAFSPDGRSVLSVSWRGEAGLWDAATGRLLSRADHVAGKVEAVAFAEGGRRALALLKDGALVDWPLLGTASEAVKFAHASVGGCLTGEQRIELGLAEELPPWCAEAPAKPVQ